MIQTVGVYHVGIPVDDLDRADRFYTNILGMRARHRTSRRATPGNVASL